MEKQSCIRVYADEQQINRCKQKLNSNEGALNSLSNILNVTGNDVRLKILFLLQQEKRLCPCDLSDILEMTVPAISQHLKKMRLAGIVQQDRIAQTIFYSISKKYEKLVSPILQVLDSMDKVGTKT